MQYMSSMVPKGLLILPVALLVFLVQVAAANPRHENVIDRCWRGRGNWAANRQRLAVCSVGFAGKMRQNRGAGVTPYTVTDPSAGIVLYEVNNVIIHGLQVHGVRAQPAGRVVRPGGAVQTVDVGDGDAIRLVTSSKVWIDHNTLSRCEDGLLDVTLGSTDVTVSNNWFHDHDKVMLLGHDDGQLTDRRMRVTVAFNRFGPNVNQRMPRIRHGYAHVVNNFYDGWRDYAIGGSMGPSVKSQGNLFIASTPDSSNVTRRMPAGDAAGKEWHWHSVGDSFENGAFFQQMGSRVRPNYNRHQAFPAASSSVVRSLTKDAGALRCSARSAC